MNLEFNLAPERIDEGSSEERATFGMFYIKFSEINVTEGYDYYTKGYRPGPLVSGYHIAEWLAWNWWRIRWESRSNTADWQFSHHMPSIGEGYVWPNVTLFSDGVRTAIISEPSTRPDAKPFRYTGSTPTVVPSSVWEGAVDGFMTQVIGRLDSAALRQTNLHKIWEDVLAERADRNAAQWRQLEALLGQDPDSSSGDIIQNLIADGEILGNEALKEIAANFAGATPSQHPPVGAMDLQQIADTRGHDASANDAVRLVSTTSLPRGGNVPAWRLGIAAAQALRAQEALGLEPINDALLAEMSGTSESAIIDTPATTTQLSFALDNQRGRIVLRSKWRSGRRFDLARILGDRIFGEQEALHPATRSFTYRQKAQRAFAAEFLSPFEKVDEVLSDDYEDEDRREEVSVHFGVSPKTIETLLMNHDRLPRPDFDQYFHIENI